MTNQPSPVTIRPMTAAERERYPATVDHDRVIALAKRHRQYPVHRIAQWLKLPVDTVVPILRDAGIKRQMGEPMTAAGIRMLLANGKDIPQVAKHYRTLPETIIRIIAAADLADVTEIRRVEADAVPVTENPKSPRGILRRLQPTDATTLACVRYNAHGAVARRLIAGFADKLRDDCRYDVQIVVREVE